MRRTPSLCAPKAVSHHANAAIIKQVRFLEGRLLKKGRHVPHEGAKLHEVGLQHARMGKDTGRNMSVLYILDEASWKLRVNFRRISGKMKNLQGM